MKAVWPDSFVEESNLTQTVFMLRKALGETPEQRYILTMQGRGYRFVAEVSGASSNGHAGINALSASPGPSPGLGQVLPTERSSAPAMSESGAMQLEFEQAPENESGHVLDKRLWLVVTGALCVLLLAVSAGYLRWSAPGAQSQQTQGRLMLAVLPFQNLTGDAGQEYFSDGLTEEMISQLGNLDPQHLGVIARTSVMHYKSTQTPLDQVGRELSVQYVVEGSVRRDANNVRVTAQLIETKDQTTSGPGNTIANSRACWFCRAKSLERSPMKFSLRLVITSRLRHRSRPRNTRRMTFI